MERTAPTYAPIRWYQSLVFRVTMLSGVLLLCLLGTVYVITIHYSREVVREIEAQTDQIEERVVIRLEENPDAPLDAIASDVEADFGIPVDLDFSDQVSPRRVALSYEQGRITRMAEHTFQFDDKNLRLTAWVSFTPQSEILHAFRNKYLAALTLGFLVTLGATIYLIARSLRPLTALSDTCARISRGDLAPVDVPARAGEVRALSETFNRMVSSLREKEVVEANLRQAQRLSALGTLAAGIAHDIRNPLNAIKLISSHAADALEEQGDSQRVVRQLGTIRSEVGRLEEIVTGFLSLAREQELKPQRIRIDTLLQECVDLIQKDAEARNVAVTAELRAGDTELMVDPRQFTRALLNVLINALEACGGGGRVRVFSRRGESTCEVEVRDTGPGIAKEVAERAFDPYFTTKHTGTGLGLSITRGIVEEHGGTIQLHSTEGHGAQVVISLPLEAARI